MIYKTTIAQRFNQLDTRYQRLFTKKRAQIVHLFLKNEPNLRTSEMNVSEVIITSYGNKSNWTPGENEPKTNPIRTQLKPIKANIKPKQTQFQNCDLTSTPKILPRLTLFLAYFNIFGGLITNLLCAVAFDIPCNYL